MVIITEIRLMKIRHLRQVLPLLCFLFTGELSAQKIQPDPQIIREMTIYARKLQRSSMNSDSSASTIKVSASSTQASFSNNSTNSTDHENLRAPAAVARLEHQAFDLLNRQRAEYNLSPLVWNERLAMVARMHSQNMARYNFFNHRGIDGEMVADRAVDFDIADWLSIGENIATNKGFRLPAETACSHWMASAGHRENILNPSWNESGLGAAIASDGTYYFTQVFMTR